MHRERYSSTSRNEVGPISESHIGDAVHIALATINGMDYLVTWNFRHVNNARMKKDPIVEEIRRIREAHAAKFNYDLKAICADLKQKEKNCRHPVVSFPPKRHLKATGS